MSLSRRDFARLVAGSGAAAALGQLGVTASVAQVAAPYRAMVGVFLFGGNDAWNMVVPNDGRHAQYAASRGAALALRQDALMPLSGTAFALHPSFRPLQSAWDEGALNVVLNTGSLFQPLDKALYNARADLRPLNLMSHSDQQAQWQGLRMRDSNVDGFMGRLTDKTAAPASLPALVSVAGSNLILIGSSASPLILPSTGTVTRSGYNAAATDNATRSRQAALAAFADAANYGQVANLTGQTLSNAYAQAVTANGIITTATSITDQHFTNPNTGAALTSDIARQLMRTARMIEARGTLGHSRQTFLVSQGGYDTHDNQVDAANTATGTQANLYNDLAMALAGFYRAMKALGLQDSVTAFTMSDFGRVYRGNAQRGTDHAWGSNHLVLGGALRDRTVHGAYPEPTLGGPDDINTDGRWLPTIAIEEYIGGIAEWHGVSGTDMPYVFPNWATWSGGGRGAVPLFA